VIDRERHCEAPQATTQSRWAEARREIAALRSQ
jgi:hypothetical protein